MTPAREVEKVAKRMYADLKPKAEEIYCEKFLPWHKMVPEIRAGWRITARWHVAQVAKARKQKKK
jgi:hypothetical protein